MEATEALTVKLARLEYLLSRNPGNSSSPPSKDDDPGKPPPPERQRGRDGLKRSRGKQPGVPGSHLAWTESPDERQNRFPQGSQTRSDPVIHGPASQNDKTLGWIAPGTERCWEFVLRLPGEPFVRTRGKVCRIGPRFSVAEH